MTRLTTSDCVWEGSKGCSLSHNLGVTTQPFTMYQRRDLSEVIKQLLPFPLWLFEVSQGIAIYVMMCKLMMSYTSMMYKHSSHAFSSITSYNIIWCHDILSWACKQPYCLAIGWYMLHNRYAAKLHVTLSLEAMLFVVILIFSSAEDTRITPNDVTLLRIHKDFIHPEEKRKRSKIS